MTGSLQASDLITVVLADDHPIVLHGLESLVREHDDMMIVGTATNGDDAVELVLRTRPRVAVLDIRMPGCDGFEATRRIMAGYPEARVIILSAFGDPHLEMEAFRAGAAGFVPKRSVARSLEEAVRLAADGKTVMPPDVARRLIEGRRSGGNGGLSERKMTIIELIAQGKTNEQIAKALGNSVSTVKGQLSELFEELGAVDRASALAICFRRGLLS